MTPNTTTMEFYDTIMDGVREYHTTALKDTEIDKRKIAPPSKVRQNKDNINAPKNALLNIFRKDTINKANHLLTSTQWKTLFNYAWRIQILGKELNGVFIKTLSETSNIVNVPWALKETERSLNAEKLADHIIATILSIHPLPPHSNAFHEFCH